MEDKETGKKSKNLKRIGVILILLVGFSLFAVQIQAKTSTNPTGNVAVDSAAIGSTVVDKATIGKPEIVSIKFLKTLPTANLTEINRREAILKNVNIHGPHVNAVTNSVGPENGTETNIQSQVRVPNILTNAPVGGAGIPPGFKATVHEPSEATDASGQNIWYTANWYAARSTDGGNTFSYVNPYADFATFCCDQDVIYDPIRDMILWYRLGIPDVNGVNYLRLGVSNDHGNTWFFYNIHPTDTDPSWTNQWWDYPQLALSNNNLYIATNMFDKNSFWTRTVMLQLPLDGLHAGSGFSYQYLPWNTNFNFGLAQGPGTQMFWASHNTNSNLRIFRWDESTNMINLFDRDIAAWTPDDTTYLCPGPDNNNWCARTDARLTGGWHAKGNIGFFWDVRQGNGFTYPYIEAATFDDVNFAYNGRPFIWNPSNAYQYGTASPDTLGNLGIGLFYGGGSFYPSHAVSIFDESTPLPPPWSLAGTNFGTNGPANNAWGDYIRVRATTTDHKWTGTAFTEQGGASGDNIDPRYVVFGRTTGGIDKQMLFVNGSDNGVWYKQYDGTTWSGWISLGGFATSNPESVTLGSNTYVFTRGGDNAEWYKFWNGVSWSSWQSLGGFVTSNPEAVVLGTKLYIFVRGSDNTEYYKTYDGTTWSANWQSLGGYVTSGADAAVLSTNLYVFVEGGDNTEYYSKFDGTAWSGWTSLGGFVTSNPETVVLGSKLYIFVRGGDNAEWYKSYDGTAWSGWTSLGGFVTSDADGSSIAGKLYIFMKGGDSAEWYKSYDGTAWSSWTSLGGFVTSNPESIALSNMYLYVKGGDNAEWYKKYDGTTWSSWTNLVGAVSSDPDASG